MSGSSIDPRVDSGAAAGRQRPVGVPAIVPECFEHLLSRASPSVKG